MAEARKRNLQIILDCLPWAYPHWVGNRFSQESVDWFTAFLASTYDRNLFDSSQPCWWLR